ncbi:sulfur reduction protein DsrE (plasmid) [Nissabacter sp. SGAir0207]|nr:sulfur reduction protein DsrE [Nissabacter sp. SGAir0207]
MRLASTVLTVVLSVAASVAVVKSPALINKVHAMNAPKDEPGFWQTPTIDGYGPVHYWDDVAYRPSVGNGDPYKIVFFINKQEVGPDQINEGLDRVARAVNLYVASGVPLDQLKFVAVLTGGATPATLNNEQFHKINGFDNPNLPLIEKLRKVGVDISVCDQSVAAHHYDRTWVDKSVTQALSGLTTVTTLEHQGYSFMPL